MKKLSFLLMAFVLVVALSACGAKKDDTAAGTTDTGSTAAASGDAQTLEVHAKNFQFDQKEYHVKAGNVNVKFVIDEGAHGLKINGTNVNFNQAGEQTVKLDKGTYDVQCSVPCGSGHLNMKTKIVVE